MEQRCFICESESEIANHTDIDAMRVSCPRCGQYDIIGLVISYLNGKNKSNYISPEMMHIISSWIRQRTILDNPLMVTSEVLDQSKRAVEPNLFEKAQMMMLHIKSKYPRLQQIFLQDISLINDVGNPLGKEVLSVLGKCFIKDLDELEYIAIRYLIETKSYLEEVRDGPSEHSPVGLRVTPEGWAYLDSLERNKESKQGFIAMCFAPELSQVHNAIWDAIEQAGWQPFSLKEERHAHNNNITNEIISGLRRARFVVADFTDEKPNTYFEAGYARGHGLNTIHMIKKAQLNKLHFDTSQIFHICWTDEELSSGELTRKLQKHITATVGFGPNYKEEK